MENGILGVDILEDIKGVDILGVRVGVDFPRQMYPLFQIVYYAISHLVFHPNLP